MHKFIGKSDVKHIMKSQVKTITSVLKALTDITTNIPARPIRLTEILTKMSVSSFKIAVILYRLNVWPFVLKITCNQKNIFLLQFFLENWNYFLSKLVFSSMKRLSWSWSYGSWIYNYPCNQCLSPLKLLVHTSLFARCTWHTIIL